MMLRITSHVTELATNETIFHKVECRHRAEEMTLVAARVRHEQTKTHTNTQGETQTETYCSSWKCEP